MLDKDAFQNCLNAAYRYLSYRPRSEGELRQRLHRHDFAAEVVEKTLVQLKEQNLVDDSAFARFWRDNRLSLKPKSKRLITRELKDKKVASEIIERVTQDIDDEDNAYRAGYSRLHVLAHLDYPHFQRRLSSYLSYRGFSYQVIKRTVALLWQEKEVH